MAAIRRSDRRGEWWVDFRYRRKRVRKRSPVQTKRGAEQYERQLRQEFAEDEAYGRNPFSGPPPTFAEFSERWMREYVRVFNRPSGLREKQWCLKHHLLPAFGTLRLDEISADDVDAFTRRAANKSLAPKTINNILTVLHCALNVAQEWGFLRTVPRMRRLHVPEQPIRFLNGDELGRLIAAAPTPFWRVFFACLAHTGLRFGEAAALHWEDVLLDQDFPRILVRRAADRGVISTTKTGRIRVIPLASNLTRALATFPRTGPLVFPKRSGGVMKPGSDRKLLHRACDRAGVKHIGWHGFRHSYATLLCERGVPLRDLQELLGHTTIAMTSRYAHARPENLRRWVAQCFAGIEESVGRKSGHQMATNSEAATTTARPTSLPVGQHSEKPRFGAGVSLVDPTGIEPEAAVAVE